MTPEMLAHPLRSGGLRHDGAHAGNGGPLISAAVDAGLDGMSHRIVEIKQSPGSGYAAAGRAEIFASHRIRPSR